MTQAQDRELVRLCTRHDREAWDRFVDLYKDYIFGLIRHGLAAGRYPATHEDAEDIFADVFLSLIEKDFQILQSFQWKCTLKTLLWAISRKRIARHFRKKGARTPKLSLSTTREDGQPTVPDPPAADLAPVDQAQDSEVHQIVRETIAELGDRDQLCLTLFFFDGLSYKDIAKVVGVPANHVGIMVFRAKKRLEERLRDKIKQE
jgi:RNA polymerase sigma-70 factor (ECF subfamily)